MNNKKCRRDQIAVMTLEQRTNLFWRISRSIFHPKVQAQSTYDVISQLHDIEEYTSLQRALGFRVSDMLDEVIRGGSTKRPTREYQQAPHIRKYAGDFEDDCALGTYDDGPEPPRAA